VEGSLVLRVLKVVLGGGKEEGRGRGREGGGRGIV